MIKPLIYQLLQRYIKTPEVNESIFSSYGRGGGHPASYIVYYNFRPNFYTPLFCQNLL